MVHIIINIMQFSYLVVKQKGNEKNRSLFA